MLQHPDPTIQRLLWDAQTEVTEAKALKNLRLHERRLQRQFEKDKAELNQLRRERFEAERQRRQAELKRQQEEAKREREQAEQQQKQEQARLRRERRLARQTAQTAPAAGSESVLLDTHGFEFTDFARLDSQQLLPGTENTGTDGQDPVKR